VRRNSWYTTDQTAWDLCLEIRKGIFNDSHTLDVDVKQQHGILTTLKQHPHEIFLLLALWLYIWDSSNLLLMRYSLGSPPE